jgi:hypothetical protein
MSEPGLNESTRLETALLRHNSGSLCERNVYSAQIHQIRSHNSSNLCNQIEIIDLSMADVALGAIGLVPVLVRTLTTFRRIHRGIKTAKRCVEHLDDIAVDLRIQYGRFLNECVLLLMESGEEEMVGRAMVKDPRHTNWTKTSTISSIQHFLGNSYDLCQKIIERIERISMKLKQMMDCFDIVRSQKMKVSLDISPLLVKEVADTAVRKNLLKSHSIGYTKASGSLSIKVRSRSRSACCRAKTPTLSLCEPKLVHSNIIICTITVIRMKSQCHNIIMTCNKFLLKHIKH